MPMNLFQSMLTIVRLSNIGLFAYHIPQATRDFKAA